MATTAKNSSEKEKSSDPSTPQQTKINTKPGFGSTSDRGVLEKKPTPSYLRATDSSTKEVCRNGKKALDDSNLETIFSRRRRSLDKPVSQAKLNRTLSANPRAPKQVYVPVRRLTSPKTDSPKRTSPKTCSPKRTFQRTKLTSPQPGSESTSKNTRPLRSQPLFTKASSMKKTSTITPKKAATSGTRRPPSTPDILVVEAPINKTEDEDRAMQKVHEGDIKVMDIEETPIETIPIPDQAPTNNVSQEEDIHKPDLLIVLEDNEEVPNQPDQIAEPEKQKPEAEVENKDENQVQVVKDETSYEGNISKEEVPKKLEETESARKVPTPTPESSDKNLGHKLSFRKGKELEEEKPVDQDIASQRLKFKEREDTREEVEPEKPEADSVVLKKQETNKGKGQSQAYNDVIEETRKELVEKRKSKVLALAEAFETVISLEKPECQTPKGNAKSPE